VFWLNIVTVLGKQKGKSVCFTWKPSAYPLALPAFVIRVHSISRKTPVFFF